MKKIYFIFLLLLYSFTGYNQTSIAVNPGERYQTIEGWGASLAWWANVAGDWSDAKIDTLCTWITSSSGLNMNVFRYNIAGEENPAHNHFRYSANLQGFKTSEFASYNFLRDSTQRKILLKLQSKRADCIFEAVAYSPPYWMTVSGCTAGNTGGTDNLKSNYFDDFADYLTDVVKYYHDTFNITFRTLAPINEPSSTWWLANGTQAGCHYSTANQVKIFKEVYNKLQAKSLLGYCTLSAMDASNARETLTELRQFVTDTLMAKISQINTHSYTKPDTIAQYTQLSDFAKSYGKRIWMSETGPLDVGSSEGFDNNLKMTDVLFRDLRNLKPVAWTDWQALSLENRWGLIQFDSLANFRKIPNYFVRMQVSRFIRPGHTIIGSNPSNTLAAINPSNDTVTVVVNNTDLTNNNYTIDLNLFGATGSAAAMYRTTAGMEGGHWKGSAYNVYTYQLKTGLANGTYTAKAWVRSSGGQSSCYMEAKSFGGTAIQSSISQSLYWTQVTIPGIVVTNGQCSIGFYSQSTKEAWCEFDDVELYLNSAPATNYITNPGFETDKTFAQTISGWSTSGTNADADFVQSTSHSNNEECLRLADVNISNGILTFTAKAKSVNTFVIPVTLAAAAPLASGNYSISAKHSNKYMSVAGWNSTDGAVIEQWDSLNQSNQVFNVELTTSGYKFLPSYNSKAITVDGYSSSNGGAINQWIDYEQLNQRFNIISTGDGYYKIVSRSSAKCLAVTGNGVSNGDDIVQWEWLNYDNFKWKFIPIALAQPLADGIYNIKAKHSNKMMSVAGGSSGNGAIIEQWDSLCVDNLQFNVSFTAEGYIINPVYNSKVVSVNNYSIADGAAVVQWEDLEQAHQRYEIVSLGSGQYKIVSRYSNKCLAVTGNGTANGDDIIQYDWLNYDNFKWSFKAACSSGARMAANEPGDMIVYPNPAVDQVTIRTTAGENLLVQLIDMTGKVRRTQKLTGKNYTIHFGRELSPGMYVIKLIGAKGTQVKKMMIQ